MALGALDRWQLRDAVPLQATVERRARQMRDAGLERVEAIVQRQQRVPPESDDHRLVLDRQYGRSGRLKGRSAVDVRRFHLATVFWLMPWRLASALRLA